ncbi:MAG: GAF domain-containing protein [Chloroflexi bacterium]|nr:GAF domain-containing protein [Chloroflexota bacterium]
MLKADSHIRQSAADGQRVRLLYSVNSMLSQLTAGSAVGDILPQLLRATLRFFEANMGALLLVDEQAHLLSAWLVEEDRLVDADPLFVRMILNEGLAGYVARTGQTAVVDDTTNDTHWMPQHRHASAKTAWSAVGVPLLAGRKVCGVLTLARPGHAQFSNDDTTLLTAIGQQAGAAVRNTQLQARGIQHAEELATLAAATATVSATLDASQVYKVVAEQMAVFAQVENCVIVDWEPQTRTFISRAVYSHARGGQQRSGLLDLGQSPVIQEVLANPMPLQLNVEGRNITAEEESLMHQLDCLSMLILPLTAQGQTFGLALLMDQNRVRIFEDAEISLAQTLATQGAIAVQNARLYADTQRQLRITRLLNEASKVINASLDLNKIMRSLLAKMNEFLRAEAVSIALLDKNSQEMVFTVAEGVGSNEIIGMRMPAAQGVSGWVLQQNTPALVNDMTTDERFNQVGDQRTGHRTQAMICAPIAVKGKAMGTIQAINPAAKDYFTEEELNVLVNLANLASSAVSNAQQFNKTQAAEARYMGLFQDSIDPIILTDKVGNIIEANGRACELLEYDRSELIRRHINNLHPVETGLLGERSYQPIQTRQIKIFTSEIITKSRRRLPVEVYAKRLFMGDNTQLLQWIYHDITEQVALEQMREDLTAMLFHDLQTPLGNVISSLELVIEDLPDNSSDMLVEMVDVAMKSSERLQRLVKSLLDINRLESGHPVTNLGIVPMMRLLDDAQDTIQATIDRRNIYVERLIPPLVPDVYIDEDMIRRVVINLLDNALKYNQDGQEIAVVVSLPTAENPLVTIAISDQGPGIPLKDRDVVFEKFRRLPENQSRKGMGLGLAFCRLAVEAHGGRIWADAGPKGGARFSFTIPTSKQGYEEAVQKAKTGKR